LRADGVRLGEIALQLDRTPDVVDRASEQRAIRLVAGARCLVLPEPRVRQADVRKRVARIERDRLLEIRHRCRHE
jgi:hypothetical protein